MCVKRTYTVLVDHITVYKLVVEADSEHEAREIASHLVPRQGSTLEWFAESDWEQDELTVFERED
jgi:hypothetical protein